MIILAIETSCDETAVAIVEFKKNKVKILANIVSSQIKAHREFGGVVPILASRMHLKNMTPVLKRAFKKARISKNKIDYLAVTEGPGLIPALVIGVSAAKTLAYLWNKPLVAVNHLEGHIYANWLKEKSELWKPKFPILCLIVSGGHTQLVLMKKDLDYKIIGETVDDAAGEAFDKVARLLGLAYPGGPLLEKIAKKGKVNKFDFPRPMIHGKDNNFSFSGLKTAVLYETQSYLTKNKMSACYQADLAASFQQAVIDVLKYKTIKAAQKHQVKNILLGGGVSANKELQKQFQEAVDKEILNFEFKAPISNLTTDNALMIAIAAYYDVVNNKNIKNWKSIQANANLRLQ